jgi:hypothetical protein
VCVCARCELVCRSLVRKKVTLVGSEGRVERQGGKAGNTEGSMWGPGRAMLESPDIFRYS